MNQPVSVKEQQLQEGISSSTSSSTEVHQTGRPLSTQNLLLRTDSGLDPQQQLSQSTTSVLTKPVGHAAQTSFLFNRNVQVNNASQSDNNQNRDGRFSLYKLWKFTGPGLLISVAYLDPGNLESDLQAGANSGYKLLWVLMYSTLAGFLLQMLSVRLGSTTGLHLAEICQREYGKLTRYLLWIMIEVAIIASDIQQVIGSALAINMLTHGSVPIWAAILITASDVFIFLLLENTGIRVMEAIFATFLAVMGASFLYMYIVAAPDQMGVVKGVLYPWCSDCSSIDVKQLIGIIGSVVMPHNIFFHSTLVLSRDFDRSESAIHEANKYYAIESGGALFFTFLFNLFVTSVSSKAFFNTPDAKNVTLFTAGTFIHDQYGLTMKIIWAIGLLAAGQCSTISATYAGQFIMEGLTNINLARWKRIIVTRSISIIPCVIVTMLAYGSIGQLNFWCNIIQAVQLPFALLPLLHFTSSKRIMGFLRNNILLKVTCYLIASCVLGVNFYFLISLILEVKKLWAYIFAGLLIVYLVFIIFFLLGVNNVYRIQLTVRRIFSGYNEVEIDELLHVAPIYRRPPDRRVNTPVAATRRNSAFGASAGSMSMGISAISTSAATTPTPAVALPSPSVGGGGNFSSLFASPVIRSRTTTDTAAGPTVHA